MLVAHLSQVGHRPSTSKHISNADLSCYKLSNRIKESARKEIVIFRGMLLMKGLVKDSSVSVHLATLEQQYLGYWSQFHVTCKF